jgi:hypothetical protein
MAKSRLSRILSRVVDIKPGEERIALLLFSYFFLITAPFTIIKAVRDQSYLDGPGFQNLPYAYATAGWICCISSFQNAGQDFPAGLDFLEPCFFHRNSFPLFSVIAERG